MKLNIVSIPTPVNETCVARLTELLEMARNGKLQDIAACGTTVDGTVVTSLSSSGNSIMRLAAVTRLLHRLHVSCDETMVDAGE